MLRKYVILRGSIPSSAERPIFFQSDAPESLKTELETGELTPAELFDESRDPLFYAAAPVMPVQLISPLATSPASDAAAWNLSQIEVEKSSYDGRGTTVAVLDTGIDAAHPAFQGVHLEQKDFSGSGNGDRHGHGTHCAGIILGRDVDGRRIGVARGVTRALIGKVVADNGKGNSDAFFRAVTWASERGAQVISVSLNFDFLATVKQLADDKGWPIELATSTALATHIANLRMLDALMGLIRTRAPSNGGLVFVAAVGNDSRRDINPDYRFTASLPAIANGVISVGALERAGDKLTVASFSNTGPTLCAPGVNIFSAKSGGGLSALSGTSMAAPHVAGAAARWWQSVGCVPKQLRASLVVGKLMSTARADVFAPGVDAADRGIGLVQAP
jgi:subtilisin family serine protease